MLTHTQSVLFVIIGVVLVRSCEKRNIKEHQVVQYQAVLCSKPDIVIVSYTSNVFVKEVCELSVVDKNYSVINSGTFKHLHKLLKLKIINSTEELMPRFIKDVPNLVSIRVTSNAITTILENVFSELPVKYLWLNKNKIKRIHCKAFDNMPNLELLDLNSNMLTEINTNWFQNTQSLYVLNFSNNSIRSLDEHSLKNLDNRNIYRLYFGYNQISSIHSDALSNIEEVEELELQRNKLYSVSNHFLAKFYYVGQLNLSYNNISCLELEYEEYKNITNLYLKGDSLPCWCINNLKLINLRTGNKIQLDPHNTCKLNSVSNKYRNRNWLYTPYNY